MTVAEAIVARLKVTAAVTALVGTRIYTLEFPQSFQAPAIRVQRISELQPTHLRGGVTVYRSRVQIDSVGRKESGYDHYGAARSVDEAVRGVGDGTGLIGFSGTVTTGAGSLIILGIIPDSVREFLAADELNEVRISRDVMVSHKG